MAKEITKTVYSFAELLELRKTNQITETALYRARQWLREGATDHEWYEFIYDEWKRGLEAIGFENPEISFSGFWSQGDGASFTANVDIEKLIGFMTDIIDAKDCLDERPESYREWMAFKNGSSLKTVQYPLKYRRLLWVKEYIECGVKRTSHYYSHEKTCKFEAEFDDKGTMDSSNRDSSKWVWNSDTPRLRKLFERWRNAVEEMRHDFCKAIYDALRTEYEWRTADEQLKEDAEANDWTFTISGVRDG